MFYDIDFNFVRRNFIQRPADSHKGSMGHALLVAGQKGMAGAALLSARACMRSGVGKLTIRTQEENRIILQLGIPEAILDIRQPNDPVQNTSPFTALAVGPGLGTNNPQQQLLNSLFKTFYEPWVIDADAINIMADNSSLLQKLPQGAILTPHKLELSRLLHRKFKDDKEELSQTVAFCKEHKIFIVMKGPHSKIVNPDGKIYVNSTGNPGMATAGSGDVLTGVILGLLARGYQPEYAATMGVFLHGLAGDLAVNELGYESLLASDIINYLPKAFLKIQE